MKAIAVIPARFASTRFPGKALSPILGIPMVWWVVKGAGRSTLLNRVLVATDDERIAAAVTSRGGEAVVTSSDHASGSDRVWEAAADLACDVIVNVQGDEPTISGAVIDACLRPLMERDDVDVATLKVPIRDSEELLRKDVVKVVTDSAGFALYFSRSPIPFPSDGEPDRELHFRHIGVYAYRKSALERFCKLPASLLEKHESLEQLRGLEAGMRYFVVKTDYRSIDVNSPADIVRAEEILKNIKENTNGS